MFSVTTNGPWLYVQLPEGAYTVQATFEDQTKQTKNVPLEDGARITRIMRWNLPQESPIYSRNIQQE
jgi:hypothetical protein